MFCSSAQPHRHSPPLVEEGDAPTVLRRFIAGVLAGLAVIGATVPARAAADNNPAWTITGLPQEIGLSQGDPLGFGISVGAHEATNIQVLQSTLVQKQSHRPLAEGRVLLCTTAVEACDGSPITLAPNKPHRLWLRPATTGWLDVGKFTGAVTVAGSQRPEGESLNTILHITSERHRLLGLLVLAIGVLVAWLVAVPVRARMQRAELLRPAIVLRDRLRALSARLLPMASMVPTLTARIRVTAAELDPNALERAGHLPSDLPSPWGGKGPDLEAYRNFIQVKGVQLSCLILLVEATTGLHALWLEAEPHRRAAIEDQLAKLDSFAEEDLTDLQALRARIRQVLEQEAAERGARALGAAEKPETYEEITLELHRLSGLVWLVYGLLTTAVGAYALVWTNPGFGVPTDYWECLFWGFGLPAAAQLMQATPATVATSLGVSLPK